MHLEQQQLMCSPSLPSCMHAGGGGVGWRVSGEGAEEGACAHPGVGVAQRLVGALRGPLALQLRLPQHAVGAHVELGLRQVHRVLVRACTAVKCGGCFVKFMCLMCL